MSASPWSKPIFWFNKLSLQAGPTPSHFSLTASHRNFILSVNVADKSDGEWTLANYYWWPSTFWQRPTTLFSTRRLSTVSRPSASIIRCSSVDATVEMVAWQRLVLPQQPSRWPQKQASRKFRRSYRIEVPHLYFMELHKKLFLENLPWKFQYWLVNIHCKCYRECSSRSWDIVVTRSVRTNGRTNERTRCMDSPKT